MAVGLHRGPTIISQRDPDYHFIFCVYPGYSLLEEEKKSKNYFSLFFLILNDLYLELLNLEFWLSGSSANSLVYLHSKESSIKSPPARGSLIVQGGRHWSENPMLRASRTRCQLHGP